MPHISGPYAQCRDCGSTALVLDREIYDAIDAVAVGQQHCPTCEASYLFTRRLTAAERAVTQQHHQPVQKGAEMATRAKPETTTPRPRAGRKNWSAGRRNTLPSNGDAPESRDVLPEKVTIGEAQRLAVEALGDITVDDAVAGGQLRQLAELYENVAREQAAYDRRSEDAKTARKALDSAQNLLMEQVRAFTHGKGLPLFDREAAEQDREAMLAGGEVATEH